MTNRATRRNSSTAPVADPVTEAAREAIARVAENPTEAAPNTVFLDSTGVLFHLKHYNRMPINEIMRSLPEPPPPMSVDEEHGVQEANTQDPDWIREVNEVLEKRYLLARDYMVMAGTSVKDNELPGGPDHQSICPQSTNCRHDPIEPSSSEDWTVLAEHLGHSIPIQSLKRYLLWVQLVAFRNITDTLTLVRGLQRFNGTLETDVAEAVAAFRGEITRGTDPGSAPQT